MGVWRTWEDCCFASRSARSSSGTGHRSSSAGSAAAGSTRPPKGSRSNGLRPGKANALLAGSAEAGGGALLVAGLATPLATSILVATMLTAIKRVHLKNGPWNGNGGYEYNAVLIAALATIAEAGPGPFSIDEAHGRGHAGDHHALRTLGIGALGAAVAHFSAEHWPAAEATTTPAEVAPAAAEPQPAG